MADRRVVVRLIANVAGYVRGLGDARARTEEFARQNRQSMEQVGKAGLALGTGLAVGVGLALKKFADFDQAMSGIQAATHETAEGMAQLREAALKAGADTAFSAVEAADAIEQLAKAGVATADILGGGLAGALDLAAAGGLAVGDAAEIAATAMTQFKLSGDQIPHVADLLAAAAGKAQGEVSDMGNALAQAGLVASQTGLTIEETTAGLASFASAGLLGSDAGTSFKSMLQRLTPQSAEAAGLMDELGISAYDAQGNFVGLEAFAGNLQTSLADLTVEQRNGAMATIFGSDAVRAAAVLYEQGAGGIAEWTAKVNDAGFAQETAAIKLDNLKGDIEAFYGSLETALIKTGEGGNGLARQALQTATGVVNAYGEMDAGAQQAVFGATALTAAVALTSGGFLVLAPRVVATRAALAALAVQLPRTTAAMSNLGKAAGIAGVLLAAYAAIEAIDSATGQAAPNVERLTDSLIDFGKSGAVSGELARVFGDDMERFQIALDAVDNRGALGTLDRLHEALSPFDSQAEIAGEALEGLSQTLAGLVQQGHPEVAARAIKELGLTMDEAKDRFPEYADALISAQTTSKLAATEQDGLAGAMDGVTGAAVEQEISLTDLMETVRGISNQVLGLRDATRGYETALDDATTALKDNGRTLDVTTEKGRQNEAALDGIATAAADVLDGMVDAGKPISDVTAAFGTQREALINAATGFGMTAEQAEVYADSVLKIPDAKATAVTLTGAEEALAQIERLRQNLITLPDQRVTIRIDEVQGTTVQRGGYAGRTIEKAEGGYISGPGTGTSDSIPALLSNGEFVVRAASVARIGVPALTAINRYASGGLVGYANGGQVSATNTASLTTATAGMTDVASIEALVKAWTDYNAQLEQAARRLDLVEASHEAEIAAVLAAGTDDAADAQERLNDANQAIRDFDYAAQRDAEAAAVDRLVDSLEAQAAALEAVAAANRQANADRVEQEDNRFAAGVLTSAEYLAILDKRIADEIAYTDEWMALTRQREAIVQGEVDTAQQAADDLAKVQADALSTLNGLLDQEQAIRSRQVVAEATYYARRSALGVAFNAEQARILDARRDALTSWARLDEVSSPAWGNTVEQLIDNAGDQLGQMREWMAELDSARSRGVSEQVISALGLDEGPQALGQLRQFNAATVGEIDALNRAVEQRTVLASQQVAREQMNSYGQLGRDLVDARVKFADEIATLEADFLAEQAEMVQQLAEIGATQGRSYGEALAAGLMSQLANVQAAAAALAAAAVVAPVTSVPTTGTPNTSTKGAPGVAAQGAPPVGKAGWFTNGANVLHVNAAGIIDQGKYTGQYPMQIPGAIAQKTYDVGGWLEPGLTLAYNGTGQRERVLTAGQMASSSGPTVIESHTYVVLDGQVIDHRVTQVLGKQRSSSQIAGSA